MSYIRQDQLPTLPQLYAANSIAPCSGQPLCTPSSALNNKIALIRSDITRLELPNGAVVNAANKRLMGGGGVDGAIHAAAGRDLLQECSKLGGCHTGQSKITAAYKMCCKNIIHTVGPIYHIMDNAPELLESCYHRSLKLAVENELDSIAFPAVSTGIYSYPSVEASCTALNTVRRFLESEDGEKLKLVVFCTYEQKDVIAYHENVSRYFPPVDEIINSNVSTGGEGNVEIAAVSNDGSENHGDKNKDCGSRPEDVDGDQHNDHHDGWTLVEVP